MTEEDDQIKREEAALEAFDPSSPTRKIVFRWPGPDGKPLRYEFVQETLGHFATIELGHVIKKLVRNVMDGKYGVDVAEILRDRSKLSAAKAEVEHEHVDLLGTEQHSHALNFGGMEDDALVAVAHAHKIDLDVIDGPVAVLQKLHSHVELDWADFYNQWKSIIEGVLEILGEVPEIEQDIIALSLGVRRRDREEFKERISEAPSRGGLTNDQYTDIIKAFIQQNVVAIRRFLGEQLREIGEVLMEAIEGLSPTTDTASTGGIESNTSLQPTPE